MNPPRPKQILSEELLGDLFRFIRQKFYSNGGPDAVSFAQDRERLLKWVILWPAGWLNGRGVTVPGERYKAILTTILLDAVRFGNTSKIGYRPAWLKMVIQSHFKKHGDDYYQEAKSARNLAEHALLTAGRSIGGPRPDPVAELAAAGALLARSKPIKKPRPQKSANLEFNL